MQKDDVIYRKQALDICNGAIDLWHGQLGEGALAAVRDRISELPPAQPEEIALHESCTDCPLYDKDRYRCPRFNKVIPETLRELQLAQSEQRWIPVSERLPEEDGKYMVTIHGYGWNGETFTSVSVAECIGKRWVGNNGVIAWMPLPEPYKPNK